MWTIVPQNLAFNKVQHMLNIEKVKQLANSGDVKRQYILGIAYQYGEGVTMDGTKAVYWYKKAAKLGNAKAQYFLGFNYYLGKYVEKDLHKAVEWLTKSAEQGDVDAIDLLEHVKSKL